MASSYAWKGGGSGHRGPGGTIWIWSSKNSLELHGASQAWAQVGVVVFYTTRVAYGSETLSENDLSRAEQSLYRIRQELAAKRDEANRAPPTPSKGWMGRFFTADQGIGAELDGLQAMERQMARSLKQLKKRKVSSTSSVTLAASLKAGSTRVQQNITRPGL